jgi:23S rRNA pseudouridine1911/1915/1917 synthase
MTKSSEKMSICINNKPFLKIILDISYMNTRLDIALSRLFAERSRSRLQSWIKNGCVQVNNTTILKPKYSLKGDETLLIEEKDEEQGYWEATEMPLDIHYEDESLIIINKAAGRVTHPAPGHRVDTLMNGLLFLYPFLRKLPRAGIIHRLDKDTTGLLVVAKTLESHAHLVNELQKRAFKREYVALVHHLVVAGDSIHLPIGRDPKQRKKMAVLPYERQNEDGELQTNSRSKPAITHYRIKEKFTHFTLLNVQLETGRTHQIRVHLSYKHYPIVGDPLYSPPNLRPRKISSSLNNALNHFKRQALHAEKLGFVHPTKQEMMHWSASIPSDFASLIQTLKNEDHNNEKI